MKVTPSSTLASRGPRMPPSVTLATTPTASIRQAAA
jgi:hypothetical protein